MKDNFQPNMHSHLKKFALLCAIAFCCQFTSAHSYDQDQKGLNDSRMNELWQTLLETNYKLKSAAEELIKHGAISASQKSDLSFFSQVNACTVISQTLKHQPTSQRNPTSLLVNTACDLREAVRKYVLSLSDLAAAENALNNEEIKEEIDPAMTAHSAKRSQYNEAVKLRNQKRKNLVDLVGENEVALIDHDLD